MQLYDCTDHLTGRETIAMIPRKRKGHGELVGAKA